MARYQRQTMLPEIGEAGQQRLARASVLVVGAGGLSATLLPLLAGAGVGFIRLYDGDSVELHNLHRQTLFGVGDVGGTGKCPGRPGTAGSCPGCRRL